MFGTVSASAIRLALVVVLLVICAFAYSTICPEHGVKAVPTGNRKTEFHRAKRLDFCEYSHSYREDRQIKVHKFWAECK